MKVIVTNNGFQYTTYPQAQAMGLGCKKYNGEEIPVGTIASLIKINRFENKPTIYCIKYNKMYYLIQAGGIEIYSL